MALKNNARISLLLLSFNLLLFTWIRSISSEGKFMSFKMTSMVSTSCKIHALVVFVCDVFGVIALLCNESLLIDAYKVCKNKQNLTSPNRI